MSYSNPTIGDVTIFAGNFAPRSWAFCHGQLLPISSNSALFSILGTVYGGDGRTTFALPDLRGRVARGVGNGPGLSNVAQGQRGGTERASIQVGNLPAHSHPHTHTATVHAEARLANEKAPLDNRFALANSDIYHDDDGATQDIQMHANTVTLSTDSSNTGSNIPLDIENPYLGLNYIIALVGDYPSRS
ncbi:phage tail protein [Parerythrobacter jejuensis]|uniref:Phage tail protein n=1 Tax=Parerythrobacter jejuensis TaxID=795812 RepID=A0A845AZ13_9SPHN|nr:tail fiber protein [Parerythrobacter jejuensis]MXP31998.1 phage tail protein [Parerythrobacter jejuensis]